MKFTLALASLLSFAAALPQADTSVTNLESFPSIGSVTITIGSATTNTTATPTSTSTSTHSNGGDGGIIGDITSFFGSVATDVTSAFGDATSFGGSVASDATSVFGQATSAVGDGSGAYRAVDLSGMKWTTLVFGGAAMGVALVLH
ncbi:hypothetical protein BT69DRAFT_1334129 [Atractiella rhizophila]|nr:hypothetical protein BT69DRAFT_1334129 [Atractiella rhizophila]